MIKKLFLLNCLALLLSGCANSDKSTVPIVKHRVECERPKARNTDFEGIWKWAQELDASIVKCNEINKAP